MSLKGGFGRRDFLAYTGVAAVALSARRSFAAELKQAPSLDGSGDLPPLAERLPENPLVIEPIGEPGRYGGTLTRALRGDADHNSLLRIVGNQGLSRWTPDFEDVAPNVAESWEVSDDATRYTFKLRRGMKWSDGAPFSADDIMFWVEDLLHDQEFYPAPPIAYVVDGEPMTAEKVDDHTITFIFKAPYGRLLYELATPLGQHPVLYAKHYAKQFHPKYNPDIQKLLTEANVGTWPELLRLRSGDIETPSRWANPERPTLDPWLVETPYSGGATEVILRRNPFFWQVDTEGNQLPYIDRINNRIISDMETIVLTAIRGDLDLQIRHLVSDIQNKPVLVQNMEQGGYKLVEVIPTACQDMGFFPNLTHKDPKMRELLRTKEFRMALSHAINRPEMIEIIWLGQGSPFQVGPLPQHRLYNEQLATQYLDYDPDKAEELLDGIGIKRQGNGMRTFADGSQLFLNIDAMLPLKQIIDGLELVKGYWADVGIDMGINALERSIFYNRAQNNEHTFGMYTMPGGLDPELEPRVYVAIHTLDSRQSIEWAKWYASGGTLGEEPTPSMKKRMELLNQWKTVADPEKADAMFKEILQMAADAFEVFGVTAPPHGFGVQNGHLHNVMDRMPQGWSYATPGPALPQQFWFDNV